MMSEGRTGLYELLPAVYRLRDAENGYPLRALLEIISEQADILRQDIDDLWDDLFVETCADWVIPYLGDLVGNRPLHAVAQRRRVDVAKTIYYRRRKGTLAILEELAQDVTGWDAARAVAFFELLGWTQNLNHLRYEMSPNFHRRDPNSVDRVGTVNLRSPDILDRLGGPFDLLSHTVDVRPIAQANGWHNIRKIGFFLWRIRSYTLGPIQPRPSADVNYGYHFSPLGHRTVLFNSQRLKSDHAGPTEPSHPLGPIPPGAFAVDLERCRQALVVGQQPKSHYFGPHASLHVTKDGADVSPESVVSMELDQQWERPPSELKYVDDEGNEVIVEITAGVDVTSGRLAFAEGKEPTGGVQVFFHYGFSADIGGGPYDRRETLAEVDAHVWHVVVKKAEPDPALCETLAEALATWDPDQYDHAVITIADNRTYAEALTLSLAGRQRLVIQAANKARPVLRFVDRRGDLSELTIEGAAGENASLRLNGLAIEGGIRVAPAGLGQLDFVHCTLVPGREVTEDGESSFSESASIVFEQGETTPELTIDRSIVGSLRLHENMQRLTVTDSIVDAPPIDDGSETASRRVAIADADTADKPGPPATLIRTTVFGEVHVKELTMASEVVFTQAVFTSRRQAGCVRFSYLPDMDSQTPRRYRCQPDLALQAAANAADEPSLCETEKALVRSRMRPAFTSVHYGDPGYAQLSLNCAEEIRAGAEDGAEMGAFNHLKQPQRETNLRIRLQEYLPFGLDPGVIYVT